MSIIRNKKIIFGLMSFILSLTFIMTLIIAIEGQKENTYKITVEGTKNEFSNSAAVFIKNINVGGSNIPFRWYEDKKNFTVYGDYLVGEKKSGNKPVITIKTSKIDDIRIHFLESENSGEITITKNDKLEMVDLYNKGDADYYFEYSYRISDILINQLKGINLINGLQFLGIFLVTFFILYFACFTFYNFIEKMVSGKLKTVDILKSTISLFLIFLSCIYLFLKELNVLTIIPIGVLLFGGLYLIRKVLKVKIEYAFIYIGLIVGMSMIFLLPPFHDPDEGAHFAKSYDASQIDREGQFKYKNGAKAYIYLPDSILDFMDKYAHSTLDMNYTLSPKNYFSDMIRTPDYNVLSTTYFWYGNTSKLSIIPYIPSTIVVGTTEFLNLPPLYLSLLGRLVNLTITLLVGFYILRNVKRFKNVFFLVMLFPIFIQQASTFNMDWLTNLSFFLLGALLINAIFSKEIITYKKALPILLVSIILALCKFGYFPIVFLALLIPSKNFESKKEEIIIKTSIIIPMIMISFLQYVMLKPLDEAGNYYTFDLIWKDPVSLAHICLTTMLYRLDLDLFRGLFDGFGWSTVWLKSFLNFVVSSIYLVFILSSAEKEETLPIKHRITFGMIAFTIFGIIYAALLFGWTVKGSFMIDGLQPRYFLPAVLLFYIVLSNKYVILNVKSKNLWYAIGIGIVYMICFFTIINKFYI